MRRRTLLHRGAVLAALGLAGCAGAPADDPTATEPPTEPATDTPMAGTSTPTPSASPTSEPAGTPTVGTPTGTGTTTDAGTPTATATPTADQSVTVGPGGQLRFQPVSFDIAVGDTVRWTWDAGGHNVKPSTVPDGSDWSGTPGGEFETFGAGYTYTHTFEVAGTYEYYCAPHRSSGMTGSFTVG